MDTSCGLRGQREQIAPEAAAGVVEQRLHRGTEGVMLPGRELDDLATLRLDGFARVFLLLHMQPTLEGDRVRDRRSAWRAEGAAGQASKAVRCRKIGREM